jgi:ABC-type ATPase with predicted acetyltransferase domain
MPSTRLAILAKWFCVPIRSGRRSPGLDETTIRRVCRLARPGCIVLISGASGSGKSLLLRRIRSRLAHRVVVSLDSIELPDRALVECFREQSLDATLSILSRLGLAEAWSYFRRPKYLSEGQRWRAKLATALEQTRNRENAVLIADEFCAVLDRLTAAIVARALRRMIDAHPTLCAVVATSHDDLVRALQPDVIVRCDFGKTTIVTRTG